MRSASILSENHPTRVFCSYAPEDEKLRARLEKHLSTMVGQGLIENWHDRKITPGEEWKGKVDEELEESKIVFALASPDFMASKYCWDVEMNRALERHRKRLSIVIPVILREVDWENSPLGALQALPRNGRPVLSRHWRSQDEALKQIANEIRTLLSTAPSKTAIPENREHDSLEPIAPQNVGVASPESSLAKTEEPTKEGKAEKLTIGIGELQNLQTTRLLSLWYEGRDEALEVLIERHSPWIRHRIRTLINRQMRRRVDSEDLLQEAMLTFWRYSPKVIVENEKQLKKLWAKIITSIVIDTSRFYRRARREMAREEELGTSATLTIPAPQDPPLRILEQKQRTTITRLGLELLNPTLREVFVLRVWEGMTHPEIAELLEITVANSRKRYIRAAEELTSLVRRIEQGDLETLLEEHP